MMKWFNRLTKCCLPVAERNQSDYNYNNVIKMGYNLTSSKKKIFLVLREVSTMGLCLEYYPNKRKYIRNALPKKQIELKSCINIEKRVDKCTNKTSIYLCTKVKSFYIQFDEDNELDEWLQLLNSLINKPENSLEDFFRNVWYISILKENLGTNTKLTGMTGFSLCNKKVKFTQYPIKSNEQKSVDIKLSSILCCGISNSLFYIQLESTSPFGSGQIWMETNSSYISNAIFDVLSERLREMQVTNCNTKFNSPNGYITPPTPKPILKIEQNKMKVTNCNTKFNSPNGYITPPTPKPILKIEKKDKPEVIPQEIDLIRSEDNLKPYDVEQLLYSIISNICITAIRCCAFYEKQFLRAVSHITHSNGIGYTSINEVYMVMKNNCLNQGSLDCEIPSGTQVVNIACRLRDYNLIIVRKEKFDVFHKVSLKVKPEMINYALDTYNFDVKLL